MGLFSTMQITAGIPAGNGAEKAPLAELGSTGMDMGQQLVQVLGSLGVVLALVLLLAWLARRLLGRSRVTQNRELRLLGGLSLGAKERIVLVQVGQQQLLLGVAPGCLQTLHVLQQPLEEQAGDASPFAEQISGVLHNSPEKKNARD